MKTVTIEFDVETYVQCEKAAHANGFETAEAWVAFLVAEKVGHTSFASER